MPTAKEASERLNVSKQTVIRWLQSGKLEGRLHETNRGLVWEVFLESLERLIAESEPQEATKPYEGGDNASPAIVKALEQNLDDLRQQLSKRDEDIERLHRLLAQANSNASEAQKALQRLTPALENKKKPWWKMFRESRTENPLD